MKDHLTSDERQTLLNLARLSIQRGLARQSPPDLKSLPITQRLKEIGAAFVTLTIDGELRGCIGALEAHQPLVEDVREHALAAAVEDPRFPPLRPAELASTHIEISRLSAPSPLPYKDADDLLAKLHPGIDGVILRDGYRRATFLPQVWDKIPDKEEFLSQLCMKMGAAPETWRRKPLQVSIYEVEEFAE